MRNQLLPILAITFSGCAADGRLEVDGKRPYRDPQNRHVAVVYTGETWPANPDRRRLNPDGTARAVSKIFSRNLGMAVTPRLALRPPTTPEHPHQVFLLTPNHSPG